MFVVFVSMYVKVKDKGCYSSRQLRDTIAKYSLESPEEQTLSVKLNKD